MAPRQASPLTPTRVVLDTNVVLDLWLFADARCALLREALHAGELVALATPAMHDELAHVLARPFVADWAVSGDEVQRMLHRHSLLAAPPPMGPDMAAPQCSDPDDQKFIDLAWHQAAWLFSRDRAVLRLAPRARTQGLTIAEPGRWPGPRSKQAAA